jgi:hypothetical protein
MKHFKDSDFQCHCNQCGLGIDDMNPGSVDRLQVARELAGVHFVLTRAVSCDSHNQKVGGSSTSSHLSGHAFDIACANDAHRWKIIDGLVKAGFTRIGVRKDFIHADDDPAKNQERLWVY